MEHYYRSALKGLNINMNSLIPCGKKCKFQKDGYCNLEQITVLSNLTQDNECIYFIPFEDKNDIKKTNKDD